MNDTKAVTYDRVGQALDYYKFVRCEVFPRVRSVISAVGAFGAAVSTTPTLQASFAVAAALSSASAARSFYAQDVFGMSDAKWLRIARENLKAARSAECSVGVQPV